MRHAVHEQRGDVHGRDVCWPTGTLPAKGVGERDDEGCSSVESASPPCPGRAPHTLTRSARADRGLCPGVTLGPSGRARGSADPLIRRSQQGVGATSEEVGIPRVNHVPSSRTRLGHWRTAHAAMRAALLLLPWALATAEDGAPYPVLDTTARVKQYKDKGGALMPEHEEMRKLIVSWARFADAKGAADAFTKSTGRRGAKAAPGEASGSKTVL